MQLIVFCKVSPPSNIPAFTVYKMKRKSKWNEIGKLNFFTRILCTYRSTNKCRYKSYHKEFHFEVKRLYSLLANNDLNAWNSSINFYVYDVWLLTVLFQKWEMKKMSHVRIVINVNNKTFDDQFEYSWKYKHISKVFLCHELIFHSSAHRCWVNCVFISFCVFTRVLRFLISF